jgi:hypothetical protein
MLDNLFSSFGYLLAFSPFLSDMITFGFIAIPTVVAENEKKSFLHCLLWWLRASFNKSPNWAITKQQSIKRANQSPPTKMSSSPKGIVSTLYYTTFCRLSWW